MKQKSILKPTIQVTVFSFAGILLSFVMQLVLAYYFGSGIERDAYFAASTIPAYVSAVFAGSIGAVFLSFYINVKTNRSAAEAVTFLSTLTNACLIFLVIVAIPGILFSDKILSLTSPGFTLAQNHLSAEILKILLPVIIFQGLTSIFTSVYQSDHNFLLPALPAVISPVLTLFIVLISHNVLGIYSVAWGTLISTFISFVVLLLFLLKKKQLVFVLAVKNEHIVSLVASALPLFISGIVFRFTSVWERLMGSKLPEGSISYLGYANQLLTTMATITTGGIATIFFPILTQAWAENNIDKLRVYFHKAIRLILLITIPCAILYLLVRVQIIQLVFERGAFDHNSTIGVSTALGFMMGAFIFQSLGGVIVRAFYFMNMTIKISVIATIELVLYILLSIVFCRLYSYAGLAIALSLSSMANILMSSVIINKIVNIFDRSLFKDFFRILISSAIPMLVIIALQWFDVFRNLFIIIPFYIVVYISIMLLLRFEELEMLKLRVIDFYKRKNGNRTNN